MSTLLLYIDPSSGSLFFQAILSGLLTVILFFSNMKIYVSSLFRRMMNRK
ncbi:hypothetical protein [Aquirufa nivalisilvae]|nr:hypothetical protein [Aquirufa nivalisilvae]